MNCIDVYIDESGDLGRYGSDYFVVACLITNDSKRIGRIIKKIRQRNLKKSLKQLAELKANNSSPWVRKKVLSMLIKYDVDIYAIVVDKSKIMSKLFEVKPRLYNYIVRILLEKIGSNEMNIIIDKKHTNTLIRDNFNSYLKSKIPGIRSIEHEFSFNSNQLQVVDFVSWAIFRKYNYGDESYYNIIKPKIRNKGDMELWKQ